MLFFSAPERITWTMTHGKDNTNTNTNTQKNQITQKFGKIKEEVPNKKFDVLNFIYSIF